jgi:hypothetical protein
VLLALREQFGRPKGTRSSQGPLTLEQEWQQIEALLDAAIGDVSVRPRTVPAAPAGA